MKKTEYKMVKLDVDGKILYRIKYKTEGDKGWEFCWNGRIFQTDDLKIAKKELLRILTQQKIDNGVWIDV